MHKLGSLVIKDSTDDTIAGIGSLVVTVDFSSSYIVGRRIVIQKAGARVGVQIGNAAVVLPV